MNDKIPTWMTKQVVREYLWKASELIEIIYGTKDGADVLYKHFLKISEEHFKERE